MRYLVDSDWIIDALANREAAIGTLRRLHEEGLAVSVVTLGEVFEGAFDDADPEAMLALYRQFLSGYRVVPLSDPIMARFARYRAQLRGQGKLIPDIDIMIAATAVAHGLVLLTRNRRHFERILDLQVYGSP